MNNPFDYIPDPACEKAFRELTLRIDSLKKSRVPADVNFCRELEAGKMLGVLIASDSSGNRHTLYAFSGQLGDSGFHYPGFVKPVFDYLQPDGYFKTHEAQISLKNHEIDLFEKGGYTKAKNEWLHMKQTQDSIIEDYKDLYRKSKAERETRRKSGMASETELASMIRQSQFEKAELRRLRKKLKSELSPYAEAMNAAQTRLDSMKEKRRKDSKNLQQWLFSNFNLLNAEGENANLSEIFAGTSMKIPPSGAGECCAPKLLQAAYLQGWHPEAIAEYWYGAPKEGELRIHGHHYPACRGKCLPVLTWMLQGLDIYPSLGEEKSAKQTLVPEILFENRWFCIVNKPSGMLSVPGKLDSKSLQEWLEEKYGPDRQVKSVHRLDQDTSGLVVAAFGSVAFRVMQLLFTYRRVKKTYVADLDGSYKEKGIPSEGMIRLPLSPDWLDRPRQKIDTENGKDALTNYEFLYDKGNVSRIMFYPLTGRTHQLRVHAASQDGLGMPIKGDRLYGIPDPEESGRLHLHAHRLEFTFPIDKKHYVFESPVPF